MVRRSVRWGRECGDGSIARAEKEVGKMMGQ